MNIRTVLFNSKIDKEKAKILLEYITGYDNVKLMMNDQEELSDENLEKFYKYEKMILDGYPVQYITNKQYFYNEQYYVNENVLIPQPDTEILVEQVINNIKNNIKEKNIFKILDLCTGSGAIAISIKKEIDEADVYASDISKDALEVAKINCKNILGDDNKIRFIESDMFEKIKELNIKFDYIISNPPYIKTDVIKELDKDVQNEPHLALDGGMDGLKFYKIIKENAFNYLNENGKIFLEIGYDQKEDLENIFKDNCVKCIKDYADNDRVIIIEK